VGAADRRWVMTWGGPRRRWEDRAIYSGPFTFDAHEPQVYALEGDISAVYVRHGMRNRIRWAKRVDAMAGWGDPARPPFASRTSQAARRSPSA
jgi:hypothetical protein